MKVLKSGDIPEDSIQMTVMEWVRLHPALSGIIFHIPNEGPRTKRYGKLLKDLGMRPGVADLFIATSCHGFHGAWIELKSRKGVLSPNQKSFLKDMEREKYFTQVCYSVDEAINIIKWYCRALLPA